MRMLGRWGGILGTQVALIAILPAPAAADPVTAVYDVQIALRYSYTTGQYEFYSQQFPFSVTFDPATGHIPGDYGTPTFSRVPLAVPGPPAGVNLTTTRWTDHHSELESDSASTYRQYAIAASVTGLPDFSDQYYRVLYLESYFTGLSSRSTITAATFPVHLGMIGGEANSLNGYGNFLFAAYRQPSIGVYTPGSFAYYGDARLNHVESPVPEPGTCALVGIGVSLLVRRRGAHEHRV